MKHPKLLFIDYPDKLLSFIEYKALMTFYIRPNKEQLGSIYMFLEDEYPVVGRHWPKWHDQFVEVQRTKPSDWRIELHNKVLNDAASFDEAQQMLQSAVRTYRRPARGKHLKAVKKGNAQEQYQRDQLGEGFIENDALLSAAKIACITLASDWAELSEIKLVAQELEDQHCKHPLSNEQRKTLLEVVMLPRIERLKTPSIVESKLLEIGDKRLYFLWGKIKQRCEVGDTIDLAQSQVLELVGGSTKGALDLVKSLVSVGALELVRKPKIGSLNGKGGKYRRLV